MKTFVQGVFAALGDPRKRLAAAVDVMMRVMDTNKNGFIDKSEFKHETD